MENKSVWFDIKGCSLHGEEEINGRVCRVLGLDNSQIGGWTLWADKKTFVIYRIQQNSFLPESALQDAVKIREDNPEEQPDGEVRAPIFKGRAYSLTVDFTTVVFNKKLAKDDFYYTGAKAKEPAK